MCYSAFYTCVYMRGQLRLGDENREIIVQLKRPTLSFTSNSAIREGVGRKHPRPGAFAKLRNALLLQFHDLLAGTENDARSGLAYKVRITDNDRW